jgi:DnaA family protein
MFKQLPLSVHLRVDATFDNFYIPGSNQVAVDALQYFCKTPTEHFFYLWGADGSGVSHLLQAVQHYSQALNIQYLPLAELLSADLDYSPDDVLSGLESLDLVVVDDLQMLAGIESWEHAFFHLYNRLRDAGKQLLVGANMSPRALPVGLADLDSRLQWGVSYQLHALSDSDKKLAILSRANAMGMRLGEEVLQFMLNHCSRDLRSLMESLQVLDQASLAEQRHLTIPFVKQVLALKPL